MSGLQKQCCNNSQKSTLITGVTYNFQQDLAHVSADAVRSVNYGPVRWCIPNFNWCYLDEIIQNSLPFHNFCQKLANRCYKGSTELYCLFIAADSIIDAFSFIRRIVLWSENKFSPNLAPARCEFLNPARSVSCQISNSQIQYNPGGNCWSPRLARRHY